MDKETTKKLFVVCADPRNSLKKSTLGFLALVYIK